MGDDRNDIATTGTIKDGFVSGWIYQPNGRGTVDIVWSCTFTIFLCTWTVLCLNVPAKEETTWGAIFVRRLRWMIIAIAGPEFVLTIASGQWASAGRSVQAFADIGYPQWTIRQGYFADMGALHLSAPDMPSFPINAKQLHFLVKHGYVEFPTIDRAKISDKSKASTIAKTVTILQTSWLVLQCIGRWAQGLALTTLELSTLAIVVCTLGTYICWLRKPLDVEIPLIIRTKHTIASILLDAGEAAKRPYWQTPLDFVDNLGPSWSANVMTFAKIPSNDPGRPVGSGPLQRPLPRFTNDRLPSLDGWRKAALFFATLVYAGIHLIGWDFPFPTHTELVLWRACSMTLFVSTFLYWFFETLAHLTRAHVWQRTLYHLLYGKAKRVEFEDELAARPPKAQAEDLPLWWEFLLLFALWCVYCAARGYLLIEMFLGLRHLPVSVYDDVSWSYFVPHI